MNVNLFLMVAQATSTSQLDSSKGYTNVVVVSQSEGAKEPIFKESSIFEGSEWVKKLGKQYVFAKGEKGLLVVADSQALSSPRDNLLRELVAFGAIDATGTIVVGKNNHGIAKLLSSLSPFNDSRSLLQNGSYRLRVMPTVTVAYGSKTGDEANASFLPKDPDNMKSLSSSDVSMLSSPSELKERKPTKIRDIRFEEFVLDSTTPSRMFDAQKIIKDLATSNHEALMNQLLAKCSQAFGVDFSSLADQAKKSGDWKDLPYDVRTSLGNMRFSSTDGAGSIPGGGKVGAVAVGVTIELGFKDPDGNGHRQSMTIYK